MSSSFALTAAPPAARTHRLLAIRKRHAQQRIIIAARSIVTSEIMPRRPIDRHKIDRRMTYRRVTNRRVRRILATISQQGPATPDHVIRTKRIPLLGQNVESYVNDYKAYFKAHASNEHVMQRMLHVLSQKSTCGALFGDALTHTTAPQARSPAP